MASTSEQGTGASPANQSYSTDPAASQLDTGPQSEPRYWNALAWITPTGGEQAAEDAARGVSGSESAAGTSQ